MEPRRPDSRTYAKVTTADDAGATTNPAQEQSADRVNAGGQTLREDSCRDGDSPRVNNSGGERAIPARANRDGAQSERGPRQSGLSDYWDSRRSPPQSPGSKCQGRNAQPRRSERGDGRTGVLPELSFLVFSVENLAGKLPDCSFINYVSSFDFVCLTETFADATFDFNGLFTEHVKFVAPAKRLSRQGRNSGGVLLLIKRSVCKFVKQIQINCANTVAVRIDKSVFNADKDILLIASYVAPEHSPFCDSMDLKDGIVILEENLVQEIRDEDLYILLCGDLNARTGCEQPKLDDMSNRRSSEIQGLHSVSAYRHGLYINTGPCLRA